MLNDYQTESRAIWYLNDASRTYRLNSGSAASGSAHGLRLCQLV